MCVTRFKLIRNINNILNVKNGVKTLLSSLFFKIFIEEKRNSRFVKAFVAKVFYDISEALRI